MIVYRHKIFSPHAIANFRKWNIWPRLFIRTDFTFVRLQKLQNLFTWWLFPSSNWNCSRKRWPNKSKTPQTSTSFSNFCDEKLQLTRWSSETENNRNYFRIRQLTTTNFHSGGNRHKTFADYFTRTFCVDHRLHATSEKFGKFEKFNSEQLFHAESFSTQTTSCLQNYCPKFLQTETSNSSRRWKVKNPEIVFRESAGFCAEGKIILKLSQTFSSAIGEILWILWKFVRIYFIKL